MPRAGAGMRPDDPHTDATGLRSIPGFYPTPASVIAMMIGRLGDFSPGDRVLEPSAGRGDIADRLAPHAGSLILVEPHPELAALLRRKGYDPVECPFEQFHPERPLDKIAMNPPFAGGLDLLHVRHAFAMLAPGGMLVALVNDGHDPRDATASQRAEFANWIWGDPAIESCGIERLAQTLFTGEENLRPSRVPMKLVTIRRRTVGADTASGLA